MYESFVVVHIIFTGGKQLLEIFWVLLLRKIWVISCQKFGYILSEICVWPSAKISFLIYMYDIFPLS